jgi:hypothetical protein
MATKACSSADVPVRGQQRSAAASAGAPRRWRRRYDARRVIAAARNRFGSALRRARCSRWCDKTARRDRLVERAVAGAALLGWRLERLGRCVVRLGVVQAARLAKRGEGVARPDG